MTAEVGLHAAAESVLAEPRLDHLEDRLALRVRDAVERVLDVVLRGDRLPDPARARDAVGVEGPRAGGDPLQRDAPLGSEAVGDLLAHPAREALVEPRVVPPRHRDEVAEPLVRELVRRDAHPRAAGVDRLFLLALDHEAHSVRDEARVLHREADPGDRDLVELLVRVRPVEVLLEQLQDPGRRLAGPRGVRRAAPRHEEAGRHAVAAHRADVDRVERADRERHQVARQRLRRSEADEIVRALARRRGGGRVREDGPSGWHAQRDLPGDLVPGLVEAGERPAGGDRLELREDVPVAPLLHREDAVAALSRDRARERRPHDRAAGGERVGGDEADEVVPAGHDARGCTRAGRAEGRRGDREAGRVQPHDRGLARDVDLDLDTARIRLGVGIERQLDGLPDRPHALGQPQLGRRRGRRPDRPGQHGGGHRQRVKHRFSWNRSQVSDAIGRRPRRQAGEPGSGSEPQKQKAPGGRSRRGPFA